ncbi:hypothetical protein BASA83_001416 [Batrachochytrium salamandrivorans]|nr:hypothetical protein BASA83_001416 [Batrachochytrium salamandrivorans]
MGTQIGSSLIASVNRLPWFVVNQVYSYVGKLTLYLHNRLDQPLSQSTLRLIMVECFDTNNIPVAKILLTHYPAYKPVWESLFIALPEMLALLHESGRVDGTQAYKISSDLLQLDCNALGQFQKMIWNMNTETEAIAQMLFDRLAPSLHLPFNISTDRAVFFHRLQSGSYNHSDVVVFLISIGRRAAAQASFNAAVVYGHADLARVLCKQHSGLVIHSKDILSALAGRRIDTVWMLVRDGSNRKCKGFQSLRRMADTLGYLELLDYANTHDIGDNIVMKITTIDVFSIDIDSAVNLAGGISAFNDTIFQKSARAGYADYIERFLDNWGDLKSMPEGACKSALSSAIFNGHSNVVKLLVERGIGISQSDVESAAAHLALHGIQCVL